ncbi:MAG UNVERIFIED_CONTAM: AAA family ATPase [Planctomycetaceae bacterium]
MTGQDTAERAQRVQRLREQVQQAAGRVVVGLQAVTDQLLMALLAGGHVLLEGVPGTAKTTLCRTFASALGIHFERIQFTPDLLPSDVTGTQVLDRGTSAFVLRKGPVFCQLLLADELNRAPARTQSALLEAMQERQVTIEGQTLPLPDPFMVLATQNPIEQEGVYRLPEVAAGPLSVSGAGRLSGASAGDRDAAASQSSGRAPVGGYNSGRNPAASQRA